MAICKRVIEGHLWVDSGPSGPMRQRRGSAVSGHAIAAGSLASPTFRPHQASAWASLLTPSNLTLHKSLDAPRCWRETCRGYKYPVELAARRGSDETFA